MKLHDNNKLNVIVSIFMRPSDYRKRQKKYELFSKSIQIGIYGYFSKSSKKELIKVKNFLISRGLNAKLAFDLEKTSITSVSNPANSLKASEYLLDSSKIHIFVVTPPETKKNIKLLDSVSLELGMAYKTRQQYVGVYFQKGYDISSLPQGACDVMHDFWANESFNQIEDVLMNIAKFCEEKIRGMYCSSDNI